MPWLFHSIHLGTDSMTDFLSEFVETLARSRCGAPASAAQRSGRAESQHDAAHLRRRRLEGKPLAE